MNKIFAAAVLASALLLAGCGAGKLVPPTTSDAVASDIALVQRYTTQICGYVADADVILQIAAAGDGVVSTAVSVAKAICSAVTSKSAMRGAVPRVKGVRITGHFVPRR
jgi:hypothetical protein